MIITEHFCSERPTDADISAFEKLIHGTLPEDYKAFLKNENGGRPKPRRFQFTTTAGRAEDSAVHYFFGLYEGRVGSLKNDFEIYKGRIPSEQTHSEMSSCSETLTRISAGFISGTTKERPNPQARRISLRLHTHSRNLSNSLPELTMTQSHEPTNAAAFPMNPLQPQTTPKPRRGE